MYWFDNIALSHLLGSDSMVVDHFAFMLTKVWTWIPMYIALLFLIIKNHANMSQILICFICGVCGVLLATGLTTFVTKPLIPRPRPCNTDTVRYLVHIAYDVWNKDNSFFSSHAATSMSLAVFFSLIVRHRVMTLAMFAHTLVTAWTRIYLGQHFFTDVLVGLIWGAFVGYLCSRIYLRYNSREEMHNTNFYTAQFTATGFAISDVNIVALTVLFAYLLALLTI